MVRLTSRCDWEGESNQSAFWRCSSISHTLSHYFWSSEPLTESGGNVDDQYLFVKNYDIISLLWCIVKPFENDTNAGVPLAKIQSYLFWSSEGTGRGIQRNKFLGLQDFKAFRKGFLPTSIVRLNFWISIIPRSVHVVSKKLEYSKTYRFRFQLKINLIHWVKIKGIIFQTNFWQYWWFTVQVSENVLSICRKMATTRSKKKQEIIKALTFLNILWYNAYNIKFNL